MIRKLLFLNITGKVGAVLLLIAITTSIFVTSCTKEPSTPADNAKFIATWNGTTTCFYLPYAGDTVFSAPPTIPLPTQENIGIGLNDNAINIGVAFGEGGCYKATYLTAIVKNNEFSFPITSFFDNCGNGYSTFGTGTVTPTGSSLSMNYNIITTYTTICTFSGIKQ